ncbi:hypothetical protein F4703DRAFT_1879561, partial [Phycomyces blakesleeanus]
MLHLSTQPLSGYEHNHHNHLSHHNINQHHHQGPIPIIATDDAQIEDSITNPHYTFTQDYHHQSSPILEFKSDHPFMHVTQEPNQVCDPLLDEVCILGQHQNTTNHNNETDNDNQEDNEEDDDDDEEEEEEEEYDDDEYDDEYEHKIETNNNQYNPTNFRLPSFQHSQYEIADRAFYCTIDKFARQNYPEHRRRAPYSFLENWFMHNMYSKSQKILLGMSTTTPVVILSGDDYMFTPPVAQNQSHFQELLEPENHRLGHEIENENDQEALDYDNLMHSWEDENFGHYDAEFEDYDYQDSLFDLSCPQDVVPWRDASDQRLHSNESNGEQAWSGEQWHQECFYSVDLEEQATDNSRRRLVNSPFSVPDPMLRDHIPMTITSSDQVQERGPEDNDNYDDDGSDDQPSDRETSSRPTLEEDRSSAGSSTSSYQSLADIMSASLEHNPKSANNNRYGSTVVASTRAFSWKSPSLLSIEPTVGLWETLCKRTVTASESLVQTTSLVLELASAGDVNKLSGEESGIKNSRMFPRPSRLFRFTVGILSVWRTLFVCAETLLSDLWGPK